MSSQCAVCHRSFETGLNRVGGADVCDPCYLGDAPRRVRERGWGFRIRQYEQFRGEDEVWYVTEASLQLSKASAFDLKCRRRTLAWKLVGLFARPIRVGDDLFDDHVHARSKTPGTAAMLLRDEGVQSILLDMLGEGSSITLHGGLLSVYSRRPEYVPEAKFSSEMCVFASHIERIGS